MVSNLADLTDMANMLSLLPSKNGLERDLKLDVGRKKGVNFCGDYVDGYEVHKLLTQEGVMLTYDLVDQDLIYIYAEKIH